MGALVLLPGLAITLPIPLGNMLPVIAIVMIALALLARDGVALRVAIIAAKLALVRTIGLVWLGADVLTPVDAASIAGHYGSISAVTFAAITATLIQLGLSLCVSFPFNLLVGIPVYITRAKAWAG
jgi:hypothetical protein